MNSSLNALSVSIGGNDEGVARAAASLRQQGMKPVVQLGLRKALVTGWSALAAERGDPASESMASIGVADDAAGGPRSIAATAQTAHGLGCHVGPLWYRGRFGAQALASMLEDAGTGPGAIDETELRGNFVAVLQGARGAWLMNDALGFVAIYGSADGRFYSTSWLAVRAYSGSVDIEGGAAIEYVLLGASHSEQTVAAAVRRVPPGYVVDLESGTTVRRVAEDFWAHDAPWPTTSVDEAAEAASEHLRKVFGEIAAAYPGRTSAALSGGFDSRLILASLLARGETPRLFVYGSESSDDVVIAREVCRAEGLALEVIDKDAEPDGSKLPGLDVLRRNALFLDGLPNDGLLDAGVDRRTRLAQSAGGHIALNGGGGEIFRNFFHLPDRTFHAREIVSSFYRGFDPGALRGAGALGAYVERLSAAISRSVDVPVGQKLDRRHVELVYPLFRCRYWMGLNNGNSLRYGAFATPLVDNIAARATASIPLAWKNAGAFQSRLITALHPGVASRRSGYGFAFDQGPDARALAAERRMLMRPVVARPWINALRRRLHKERIAESLVAHWRAQLPGEWRVDPWMDVTRLPDEGAFARAVSIEVVSRELTP